jgi:hypothetical protein
LTLDVAPRAAREPERHARWWREHRSAAPLLFEDELRLAFDQIRAHPEIGAPDFLPDLRRRI